MSINRDTRKNLLDWLAADGVRWYGRLDDVAFLSRVYDLAQLPSSDYRFKDAAGAIWQHRENNNDWDEGGPSGVQIRLSLDSPRTETDWCHGPA